MARLYQAPYWHHSVMCDLFYLLIFAREARAFKAKAAFEESSHLEMSERRAHALSPDLHTSGVLGACQGFAEEDIRDETEWLFPPGASAY